ncbi:MAG: hypothetical protein ABUL62_15750 [Myxococcales bacterium]|jgi:hypothetical protein
MNKLELGAIYSAGFEAAPTLNEKALGIEFSGTGDMNAIALLSEYLKQVHAEALRLNVAEVSCDLQKLVFMNSSCFKSFVVWIDTVKTSPVRYQIAFKTNPTLHWQRRSLEALRRLAANIVTIETMA